MTFDDFREITKLTEAFERAQVLVDLNNDMAGRETGRIRRVIHDEVGPAVEKRKAQERLDRLFVEAALQSLLADPVYRARWEEFGTFLASYSTAAQTALERAMEASTAARDAVRDALENAHTLDGQPVFETDDGRFVYTDGAEIDPGEAGDIVMSGDAITYDEYQALENRAAEAERAIEDIRAFQDKLDAAEAKRTDPDNPYRTPEEMDAEERRLEAETPDFVKRALEDLNNEAGMRSTPASGDKPVI